MATDAQVCWAAAAAQHPRGSIPPRGKYGLLGDLQSGRNGLPLPLALLSPFIWVRVWQGMTKELRMLHGAGLCCALMLALGSAGRLFLPGLCICNLNLIP